MDTMTHTWGKNTRENIEARFVADDECLIWTGFVANLHRSPTGYGRVNFDKKIWYVHRLVWTWNRGPIPEGMTVDHLCQNTLCQNVDHMELVSSAENRRRCTDRATMCGNGLHPYPENRRRVKTTGESYCQVCNREASARSYQRSKA